MRGRGVSFRFLLLLVFLAAVFSCQTVLVSHAATLTQAEREKRAAEERQKEAGKSIENLERNKTAAADEAGSLGRELTALLKDMELLETEIDDIRSEIAEADKICRSKKADQDRQYASMKKRIQYLYEDGEITYLDILLKAKNVGDVIRGTEYFRQLYEYDKNMILDYEKIKKEAQRQKEALEEQRSELLTMEDEQSLRKKNLETMLEAKKSQVRDFEQRLTAAKREAEALARTVREKNEEIQLLRQQQVRRRQEQEAARRRTAGQTTAGGNAGESAAERTAGGQTTAGGNTGQNAAERTASGKTASGTPVKSTGGTLFGRKVADYALQFVGNPYVWGGTSLTKGADCSGFTQSVYRHFGVNIPRTSGEQAGFGREVAYEDMEPGDLICYPGHVSMYIGDGKIVHARSTKAGIRVDNDPAYRTIVSIRRPW